MVVLFVVLLIIVGETEESVVISWRLKQVNLMLAVQWGELGVGLLDHLVLLESFQASELIPGGPAWGVLQILVE